MPIVFTNDPRTQVLARGAFSRREPVFVCELAAVVEDYDDIVATLEEYENLICVVDFYEELTSTVDYYDDLTVVVEDYNDIVAVMDCYGGGGVAVREIPFEDVAEVVVAHGLGRLPVVQVLVERSGGSFSGGGGFGSGGFGASTELEDLSEDNFELVHIDENTFRVTMNNYYSGVILCI